MDLEPTSVEPAGLASPVTYNVPSGVVADVFLGAEMSSWNDICDSAAKLELQRWGRASISVGQTSWQTPRKRGQVQDLVVLCRASAGEPEIGARRVKLKYSMGTPINRKDE